MKTKKRDLFEALKVLTRVADEKAAIPVLRCVRLQAQGGALRVTATDFNARLTARLYAEGELDVCVPAKVLQNLIKPESRKDTSSVTIEVFNEAHVTVEVDGIESRLASVPVEDFPAARIGMGLNRMADWLSEELAGSMEYVLRAVSKDETRPHLCGVYLDSEGVAVTTDGHRAHVSPLPDSLPVSMLIPTASALVLRRILPHGERILIEKGDEHVRMSVGMWTLEAALSSSDFPPYRQIVPSRTETHVVVDGETFAKALHRVGKLSSKSVRLTVNGEVTLSASDPELGETIVPVETLANDHEAAEDLTIGLDPRYLKDCLADNAETVSFNLNGKLDALRIEMPDEKLAVLMPMRV